jgi:hypothetical protein
MAIRIERREFIGTLGSVTLSLPLVARSADGQATDY